MTAILGSSLILISFSVDMPSLINDYVTRQADRKPEALAITLDDDSLTYGELETFSNQLARTLIQQGSQRGDRVCVLMPKSPLAIACQIGIYKADCIYVPLDSASPAVRLLKIINACEPRLILAAGAVLPTLKAIREQHGNTPAIGWLDETESNAADQLPVAFGKTDVLRQSGQSRKNENQDSDPAHIFFTSGSTGEPKGVVVTHANVHAFIQWAVHYFDIKAADRLSNHAALHFDLSTIDIFSALATGAQLHMVPNRCRLLPNKMADWIRASRVTQWCSVPSVLTYMAKFGVVRQNDFPELKRVLWCGEVFPTPALIHWMKRVPHASFTNLYGPTEATIASSYYTLESCPQSEDAAIPIGQACDGEELLVLNQTLAPVQNNEIGDLYIRGVGLSPGYWRNQEETDKVFLSAADNTNGHSRLYKTGDLARVGNDGLLYFAGRNDYQIKSRGYRIELGEIEAALHTIESLRDCAVVAVKSEDFDGMKICCAYVPFEANASVEESAITPLKLRAWLSKKLPDYMLPIQWRSMHELPRNPTGKIDRRSLKELWQEEV